MIQTSIKTLDKILDGGIKNGIITDIFGANGTGKTQLCMQIAANSLQKGGKVLFLDTTGEFRPERLLEILENNQLKKSLLDNVTVGRVTNTSEQIHYLSKIQNLDDFSLIIIDNVSDLFSFEYAKEKKELDKRILFMNYMHNLSLFAIQKKIPIIVTNMIRKIDDIEIENLEKPINLFTHMKIRLEKKGTKFFGQLLPTFGNRRQFSYVITKQGLVEQS